MQVDIFSIKTIKSPSLTQPYLSQLTSCKSTKYNLYLVTSLATVVTDPDLYRFLTFQIPSHMSFSFTQFVKRFRPK